MKNKKILKHKLKCRFGTTFTLLFYGDLSVTLKKKRKHFPNIKCLNIILPESVYMWKFYSDGREGYVPLFQLCVEFLFLHVVDPMNQPSISTN